MESSVNDSAIGVDSLFSIRGKIALVTGGSRGIGLMIARGFVEAGATVYISSRKAEICNHVAGELSAIGRCVSLPADLSTLDGVEVLVRQMAEREEKLHILVNNAGAAWGEPIETFPEIGFDKITDLNLKSLFFLTRDLLPLLRTLRHRRGACADHQHRLHRRPSRALHAETYSYAAAKAAVHHSPDLAMQLAAPPSRSNAVAPGSFEPR